MGARVKIMHVLHYFPPEFRGGTEACVETLAAAQRMIGHDVVVCCGTDEREPDGGVATEDLAGLVVHRVRRRPAQNYGIDYRYDDVAERVIDIARSERADIVHVHHTMTLSLDLATRLDAAGFPVVATLHDFTLVCARQFLVRPDGTSCADAFPLPDLERCSACVRPDVDMSDEQLTRELVVRGDVASSESKAIRRAIVPSRTVHERWSRSGLFADALVVLPHAARLAAHRVPAPRERSDGRLVLATWGHLAPAKGVLDLLAALHSAHDPRLALLILGEPVDATHAEELLDAAEGLDVEFRGRYGPAEIQSLRSEADLAVFMSRAEETFGLVVAEARAVNFPVVVSDRGALKEGVGAAGAVVPAADPEALAALLVELAGDEERLARWAAAPRDDVLDPGTHAERVVEIYDEALALGTALP